MGRCLYFYASSNRGLESYLQTELYVGKERQSFRSALEAVNTVNMSTEWCICLTRNRHMGLCVYNFSLCRTSPGLVLHVHHPTLMRKAYSWSKVRESSHGRIRGEGGNSHSNKEL